MPTSTDSKHKRVANGSPVTPQTLRQQGGTGEDGHIHLADWALSIVVIKKKKNSLRICIFKAVHFSVKVGGKGGRGACFQILLLFLTAEGRIFFELNVDSFLAEFS